MAIYQKDNTFYIRTRLVTSFFVKSLQTDNVRTAKKISNLIDIYRKELLDKKIDITKIRGFLKTFTEQVILRAKDNDDVFNMILTRPAESTISNEKTFVKFKPESSSRDIIKTIKQELTQVQDVLEIENQYILEDSLLQDRIDGLLLRFAE